MEQREINALMALATSDEQAIADVSRAVRRLEQAQDAKARLQALPAEVLRAAIGARNQVLKPIEGAAG